MISFWIFPGYAKVMKSNLKRANYYEICLTSKILVKALKRKKNLENLKSNKNNAQIANHFKRKIIFKTKFLYLSKSLLFTLLA